MLDSDAGLMIAERPKMEWNDMGKRILHAVFGAFFGFILGYGYCLRYSYNHVFLIAAASSLLLGVVAFACTDEFWEKIGRG